ncbi:hypothetical protein, partial [uncultured Shimia sp.]|uniref:hypothetical protein n=1 Tax=uncultured Shimia sp. TaxID=573152 RepID=UPI002636C2E2
FSRLFAILSPPFPNLNGGPIQMGRLTHSKIVCVFRQIWDGLESLLFQVERFKKVRVYESHCCDV